MTLPTPDAPAFRHVMGHFGSGVTVVTSRGAEGSVGFTASSVASLSLEPPLIMVGVSLEGETLAAIRTSGAFAVNVLTREQEPVARRFAGPDREDRFRDLPTAEGPTGSPLLSTGLAWLDCRVHAEVPAGDHVVIVGAVEACEALPGEPLLYYRGRFGGWLP